MALKPFNSVAGFSVGEVPSANIILANGDITASNATFSGNLLISNANASWGVKTDNLYYSNGVPYDLGGSPAGSNNQIQYNIGGEFAASANFTFDPATNLLTVSGNIDVANADLGNLVIANYANLSNDLVVQGNIANANNVNVTNALSANTGNFSGNITSLNANLGNLATANFVNVASNVTTSNLTVNLELSGNTANFSGNIKTLNANLGNLVTANYANFTNDIVVQGNIANANNVNVTNALSANTGNFSGNITSLNANLGNLATANFINVSSNIVSNNTTVNLELQANTANFDGNVVMDNWLSVANTANVGNLRTDNLLYANGLPWDMQEAAGSNNEIQFNINDNFAASANLTYNDTTQQFTVLGNSQFNNANLGNLAIANFANIASNVTTSNLTVNLALGGNTANFSGNVIVPNLTVNLALSGNTANFTGNLTAANGNLGNLVIANFVQTGTVLNGNSNVVINANGNIVITATSNSTVTISDLGANIIGYVTANGDGSFGAVKSNSVTAQGGNLTLYAAAGNNYVELRPTGTGHIDAGNFKIQNLGTPNASSDAATKQYVDDIAQGLHVHAPCFTATSNTLAILTSGTITYNNGTAGVGANLVLSGSPTADYTTANCFDGNTTAVVGSRILVKDESNLAHNGIYVVDSATVLTRADDFDTPTEMAGGDFTFVSNGDDYNDTGWVMTDPVTTVGTSPVIFIQFSGAGTFQAGAGLTLTGTVFSVNVDNITTEINGGNVVVKANAQFTTPNIGAATGTSLAVTGNIVAANIAANTLITTTDLSATGNILAANISANANLTVNNATINLALAGNTANFSGNVILNNLTTNLALAGNTANFSGNVILNNLTTNLELAGNTANFSGNVVVPNLAVNLALTGNTANFSGNVILNNLTTNLELAGNTANFSGNVVVPNLAVNLALAGNTANFSGNVIVPNLTVNLALSGNTANFTGNISALNANLGNLATANFFTGTLINGTSNIVVNNNGNIDLTSGGNTTLVVTATGANVNGYANVSGNLSAANIAANIANVTNVKLGNTQIGFGTATTTSISANQTISTLSVTGVTGIEFLVKGVDSSGSKYVVATVQAVTDGTSVDFTTFGTVNLGGLAGIFAVNIVGSNVALQVSPSSTNSTVWTTQFRTI